MPIQQHVIHAGVIPDSCRLHRVTEPLIHDTCNSENVNFEPECIIHEKEHSIKKKVPESYHCGIINTLSIFLVQDGEDVCIS